MLKVVLGVWLLVLGIEGAAQVHKCTDSSGKSTFSDTPCPTSAKQSQQVLGASATISPNDPLASQRTRMSIERAAEINRSTSEFSIEQSQSTARGSEIDAGRTRNEGPRSAFAPDQYDAPETVTPRNGPIGGSRASNPNWSPRRGYYGGGGPADQRYEAEQAARQRQRVAPGQMVNCDRAGCWGANNGVRYNFAAGGNMNGSDGSFCTRTGPNGFNCN